ncbi:hypothetical protein CMEL01_12046, partial [Colletotrichum melonis]
HTHTHTSPNPIRSQLRQSDLGSIQPRHQPPALPSRRGPSILSAHSSGAAWVTGTRSQRRLTE